MLPVAAGLMPDPRDPVSTSRAERTLFRPRATTIFRVVLVAVVFLVAGTASAVWTYFHSPYWNRIGMAPDQPVLFSHRHHAGELRIDCRFCHATVETSSYAGMPATETCLGCHAHLFTDTAMLRPVVQSAETGKPLVWSRVTRLPDHVYFDHSIHIAKGIACLACHGEVGKLALTAKNEPLTMRQCIECHRDPAPHLVERSVQFAAMKTDAAPAVTADMLARAYQIHPEHLTNCSTCHH